jgi:hypothetical protein
VWIGLIEFKHKRKDAAPVGFMQVRRSHASFTCVVEMGGKTWTARQFAYQQFLTEAYRSLLTLRWDRTLVGQEQEWVARKVSSTSQTERSAGPQRFPPLSDPSRDDMS